MGDREYAAFDLWLDRAFLPYHREWIGDPSPFALAVKARQVAFSSASAGGCVFWGLGSGRPQLVLSASQGLSDEVLSKARAHCELLAACGHRGAMDFAVDSATEIAWKSGGRIVALPANPRTARSFAGDVWLDEYAYHQDPEAIRDGAFAMASTGDYRVRVFSTPNGAQGQFYDWVTAPPKGWSLHRVPIDKAVAQGFRVDVAKLWQLCGGDERVFAQWYRCRFLDANLQYVPSAMANRAINWAGSMPSLAGAEFHAGLDVGREHDLTALVIVAVVRRVAWVVATLTCRRTDFETQKRMVRDARDAFRWSTLHVDKTGIGTQMSEEMVKEWGDEEVREVSFTNESKADLATRALRWLRDDAVRFTKDADGKALHGETVAVRRKVTASNNITYSVPRSAAGHGDRWWALCLALKGAGEPPLVRGMGQEPLLQVA